MSADPDYFAFPLGWNAQDLADAVPLRLFELFDVTFQPADVANASSLRPRAARAGGYLPAAAPAPCFRVRG